MRISVATSFQILLIVLFVVAPQVAEREPIMRGDEINAGVRRPALRPKDLVAAAEALGKLGGRTTVTLPESACPVPIAPVQFAPGRRERANLIAVRTKIPWFRDHLHARELRIIGDGLEKWGLTVELR